MKPSLCLEACTQQLVTATNTSCYYPLPTTTTTTTTTTPAATTTTTKNL